MLTGCLGWSVGRGTSGSPFRRNICLVGRTRLLCNTVPTTVLIAGVHIRGHISAKDHETIIPEKFFTNKSLQFFYVHLYDYIYDNPIPYLTRISGITDRASTLLHVTSRAQSAIRSCCRIHLNAREAGIQDSFVVLQLY